jgi:putative hydrolase of the HAD superfamily
MTFVESGFNAVSNLISSKFKLNKVEVYSSLIDILSKHGRGKVFDRFLKYSGLLSPDLVEEMVRVYRSHRPIIGLYADALPTFRVLRELNMKLGIVTDGLCSVQENKVRALGLVELVDIIIFTDEMGKEYWKPHHKAFQLASRLLDVKPSEAIYIGNDPTKDFVGPKSIGMQAVHLCRNKYEIEKSCEASIHITGLDEVISNIIVRGKKS